MKENGKRVTDGAQTEVQVEIIFRNRVRACVIFPFVFSSIPKFTLIIHISISKSLHTVRIGFYLYLWNNLSYTAMY